MEVRAGDRSTVREVTVGGGHAGGQLGWIHFGLGDATGRRSASPGRTARWGRGCRSLQTASRRSIAAASRRLRVDAGRRAGGRDDDTTRTARLAEVDLPDFGMPEASPELPPRLYAARLERLRERMDAAATTGSSSTPTASTAPTCPYLTGFDPRFEEAILVVAPTGPPVVLVGNECFGMAGAGSPADGPRALPGPQPAEPAARPVPAAGGDPPRRGRRRRRRGSGSSAGRRTRRPEQIDAPAFLVDELRALAGASGAVENATGLLIAAGDGLRVVNEVEQLAFDGVGRVPDVVGRAAPAARPAARPDRARGRALLGWNGWPLSCHLMLTAGPRRRSGC